MEHVRGLIPSGATEEHLLAELTQQALIRAHAVARVGAWAWDLEADRGTWSPDLYHLFGRDPEREPFSLERFLDYIHPEDRDRVDAAVRLALTEGTSLALDFRSLLPDGTTRWYAVRGTPESRQGRVVGMIGTIQDIDTRHRTEEALHEREQLLESITSNSPVPIFMKDRSGTYLYVNDAYVSTAQIPREQILGSTDLDLYPLEIALLYQANDKLAMDSAKPILREEILRVNEEDHRFSVVKFPTVDAKGNIFGVCGISVDITASLRTEQFRNEERERIAADIHDDSVQVMASVALRLETLERSVRDADQRHRISELRETVRASIDRLRKVMIDLQTPMAENQGLLSALQEILEQIHRDHSIPFELAVGLDHDPPSTSAVQILRIAREALTNVVKHAEASRVIVTVTPIDGGIQVSIVDDGIGFDDSVSSPLGHLGLSSMRARAHAMGGLCSIQSLPGEGTKVTIWFPEQVRQAALRVAR